MESPGHHGQLCEVRAVPARVDDSRAKARARVVLPLIISALAIPLASCGTTSSKSTGPTVVTVIVQPPSANLFLGQTQQFQATVTGATNTTVTWQVNGVTGGTASTGTISAGGDYTAPETLPSPATVTVTAVSNADGQATGSASVTLMDDIAVSVSPNPVNVTAGGAQVFTANVTGTGNASTGVTWSVNGVSGGNVTVGTIVANGANTAVYTAPLTPPSPATVSVTATSVADATKSGSASATVTCPGTNSITPATASIALGQTQDFTTTFCIAAGTAITWDVNGVTDGNASLGTIVVSSASMAAYTAPADLPSPNPVTVHATATLEQGGTQTVSATITITSSVTVNVTPGATALAVNQRMTFTANVTNTSDSAVTWSVDGAANGNAIVGQVCEVASNPCVAPAGPVSGSVDYLAPAAVPLSNPVMLTATSRADATKSGSAIIAITGTAGPVAVEISPPFAMVAPSTGTLSTMQFFASVTETSNTAVMWSVQSGVAGQGCGGAACGSVDANGLYTAPTAAPSPNAISITATSQADSTKSATATITINTGPLIDVILPSSVMAGSVEGFTFEVEGLNFVAGSGSGASLILLNGVAQATTCATTESCTMALTPAQVAAAGTMSVQVQNPSPPGALSNPVPFVIVPFDVTVDVIALSTSVPVVSGMNIVVVEPTTAAESSPINVEFIGLLTGGDNCGVQGSPLTVTRPASGTTTVSICVNGNGLDPTFTYAFTGPTGGDIGVTASAISGLFPGTIELDLQISSTTLPGLRTLFITTPNEDQAVATGMLEVE